MVEPKRAQYGGGIIVNPGFDQRLEGWTVSGKGGIEVRSSKEGNRFIVAKNRTHPLHSFSQKIQLLKGRLYTFSAWVQVSEGRETVSVIFRSNGSEVSRGGHVTAQHGCWTMLKGGIVANFSTSAHILFESENSEVELWVDSVSLQPFTKKQWRSHQDYSIERIRKRKIRFQLTHTNETTSLEGAIVYINGTRSSFPFGCGMNLNILTSKEYQTWFASRFKYTTFTNSMKWYSTEIKPGEENYNIADSMMAFTKQNNICVRGHNVLWDAPDKQTQWVKSLSSEELRKAVEKRVNSVVSRYRGQLIAWDVMNENLHFSFFEDKLGKNASAEYYSMSYKIDPKTVMFMNEYNAIEYSGDKKVTPEKYKKKLEEIRSFPGSEGMLVGIGLQGHFTAGQPNVAYMRSVLDALSNLGLPIWLTEVSVDKDPNQAQYLEEILREGYSHPGVEGIITFSGPIIAGFKDMPLADENFHNTPAGDVVDKLLKEWKSEPMKAQADSNGFVDVSLFHGDYDCLKEPKRAQYGGGIIVNPGFDQRLEGWKVSGKGGIEVRSSKEGNRFIVAKNRTHPLHSFSQKIQLLKGRLYTFSAWVQVSEGRETVSVIFRSNGSEVSRGGHVTAQHGCWTMLKGGIVANFSTSAHILFESENSEVELWVDNVSLQPFTKKQWRSHQDYSIERIRKRKVRFQISHTNETALDKAVVYINGARSSFPFGCGMNLNILTSKEYQTWFVSRFKYTTFTNSMKWYSTEIKQGQENYTIADSMMAFTKQNNIRAEYLEEILKEGYSHPAVEGIITFGGPITAGFKDMPLADENFHNTPAGDVVDKLLKEWKSGPMKAQADSNGFVDVSLFHGDYDVTVVHPITKSSITQKLSVHKDAPQETVQLKIHA
ncbi:endo-1,4-beta-xylanase 5-like isoform X2 [Senna tora]|uniref:Endo-1,4-beta-xylanase 5-like isoform X2 n=1 Tax=Senna tora TaxID=362788 RepID=A0A834W5Z4_9FABA|nr:endo-1,4-beta-xylanase 5-like isoform X2 [Senna tora]